MNGRTAALHNLGCKVNAYETEAMQQQLEEAGYRIVPFTEKADVYIINTCSVTNIADRKSRQMLHRAKNLNPDGVVVAAGCYVQTAAEKTGLPADADIILGNDRKKELVSVLNHWFAENGRRAGTEEAVTATETDGETMPETAETKSKVVLTPAKEFSAYESLHLSRTAEHTRAFLKVQDGCNQFCTYCIIPYARGRIRSRDMEEVREEIGVLTDSGVREIILTGIHLSSYGLDRKDGTGLADLIRMTASAPGVKRIRLGSLEPGIVTEDFARQLRDIESFCPHFHLSLQSGSDTVLRRMNRRYTTREYAEKCVLLREIFDDPAITTDVIAGFPGETEEEFAETVAYLEKLALYETHIFKYSRREGTAAARMSGQIPEKAKTERSNVLIGLGKKNRDLFVRRHEGKRCEVLFEGEVREEGNRFLTGYTREYIRVHRPLSEGESARINETETGIFLMRDGRQIWMRDGE